MKSFALVLMLQSVLCCLTIFSEWGTILFTSGWIDCCKLGTIFSPRHYIVMAMTPKLVSFATSLSQVPPLPGATFGKQMSEPKAYFVLGLVISYSTMYDFRHSRRMALRDESCRGSLTSRCPSYICQ